ncbi:MAG: hypothetical protein STHCBS139747_007884 [Sporothrix thermara]
MILALYEAEKPPQDTHSAAARDALRRVTTLYQPTYDMLEPQKMDPETGIKIMPYSKEKGYGWLWTYATPLLRGDSYANDPKMWLMDDKMKECVVLMMAYRPADRMDLATLQAIARDKLNEPEQELGELLDLVLEKRECRDKDMFTDDCLQVLTDLLHKGVPVYNSSNVNINTLDTEI